MNRAPQTHAAIAGFAVQDNCLRIGGMSLTRLADRAGCTPFFAYDRGLISKRVSQLRRSLPKAVHLSYAVKANPMPAVVQHLAGLVDGFDVASAAELKTVLDTTIPPEHVSFAGPGKRREELSQAMSAGVPINMESEAEMEKIAALAEAKGIRPSVAVRVNPNFELKSAGLRMGGGAQQFGVDAERVPRMLSRLAALDLEFTGFQIFCGSQNLRAESLGEAQRKSIALATELSSHLPGPVRTLNIGGGFGIPYFPGETHLDLSEVGKNMAELMPVVERTFQGTRLVLELGRYLVGEAGIYVCRVVDRKESRGQVFLVTDGGLHHHLTASGNLGTVIRRNFPMTIGNRMGQAPSERVTVVGCLCTPFDLLAEKVELPSSKVGDLVVIFQSGAYGLTASPTDFLSHPRAPEILV